MLRKIVNGVDLSNPIDRAFFVANNVKSGEDVRIDIELEKCSAYSDLPIRTTTEQLSGHFFPKVYLIRYEDGKEFYRTEGS